MTEDIKQQYSDKSTQSTFARNFFYFPKLFVCFEKFKMALLKSLLRFLIFELFRPYKTTEHMQKLLDFCKISQEAHRNREWKQIFPFYVVPIFYIVIAIHLVFLSLVNLSQIEALIFGDILQMYHVPGQLYLLILLHVALTIYYYYTVFNNLDFYAEWQAQAILNEETQKLFYTGYKYRGVQVATYIRRKMQIILNIVTIFVYGFSKFKNTMQKSLH